ncbi:MAG: diaminopimelate epimerase [Hyphomicrobiales bacterium]|nr:diaminopimelate epimerase [Hyphomicrobiales bacterium]
MNDAIAFAKMNGLGNAITVADFRGRNRVLSPAQARAIAAAEATRCDQIMALHDAASPDAAAFVRIYNADGSEAEACGNGNRCVAVVLAEQAGGPDVAFETRAGRIEAEVHDDGSVSVDMGEPRLGWRDIPLAAEIDTKMFDLSRIIPGLPGLDAASAVNVGNPHCVCFVDTIAVHDLAAVGPQVETHPFFPARVNFSLAQIVSGEMIRLAVWERGAGLTRACGTAACAAVVAAARNGLADRNATVALPGGDLRIHWRECDNRIHMTGPYELEARGHIPASLLEASAS